MACRCKTAPCKDYTQGEKQQAGNQPIADLTQIQTLFAPISVD
jgi:hypothetical protein